MSMWQREEYATTKAVTVIMKRIQYPLHAEHCSKHFLCINDFVEHHRGTFIFRFMDFPVSLSSVIIGGGCFIDKYDFCLLSSYYRAMCQMPLIIENTNGKHQPKYPRSSLNLRQHTYKENHTQAYKVKVSSTKQKEITLKATEEKDIPTQKTLAPGAKVLWVNSTENLRMKHQYYTTPQRIGKQGVESLLKLFHEANIIVTPKPDKDIARKENY